MIRYQNTDVSFFEMNDDFLNIDHCQWVDAGKGFIQQNERRIGYKTTCNFKTSSFPAGKNTGFLVRKMVDTQF